MNECAILQIHRYQALGFPHSERLDMGTVLGQIVTVMTHHQHSSLRTQLMQQKRPSTVALPH